jgi:hypothetical protein
MALSRKDNAIGNDADMSHDTISMSALILNHIFDYNGQR